MGKTKKTGTKNFDLLSQSLSCWFEADSSPIGRRVYEFFTLS